jgi:hypothetical protein
VAHRAAARACRWALAAARRRPGYGLRVAVRGGPGRATSPALTSCPPARS